MDKIESKNALISVFDRTGIEAFAQALVSLGWTIYSYGDTAECLSKAGVPVTDVKDLVGGEDILSYKFKTSSREVDARLSLTVYNEDYFLDMEKLGLPYIDLVCCDMYPLTAGMKNFNLAPVVAKTDIGGPTMVRSGVKHGRIVLADSRERKGVIEWLKAGRPDKEAFMKELAFKAEYIVFVAQLGSQVKA